MEFRARCIEVAPQRQDPGSRSILLGPGFRGMSDGSSGTSKDRTEAADWPYQTPPRMASGPCGAGEREGCCRPWMLPSFDAAIAIEMELRCQQSITQLPTTTTVRRLDEALPRLSTRQGHLLPPTHSQRPVFGNVANPLGRGRKVTIQIPILALPPALPPSTLNFAIDPRPPIHRPRAPPNVFSIANLPHGIDHFNSPPISLDLWPYAPSPYIVRGGRFGTPGRPWSCQAADGEEERRREQQRVVKGRGTRQDERQQDQEGGHERLQHPRWLQDELARFESFAGHGKICCRQRLTAGQRRALQAVTKSLAKARPNPSSTFRPPSRCHRGCMLNIPGHSRLPVWREEHGQLRARCAGLRLCRRLA